MPWVAGQSGNPCGRPPSKYSIRSILTRIGNQSVETSAGKMRKAEIMWLSIYNEAMKGDVKAAFLIADRLEGKAPQGIDLTSNGQTMAQPQPIVVATQAAKDTLDSIAESL